jgi:hypothetical protein
MNIKDQFLGMGAFKVQDGKQDGFWEDKWLSANALKLGVSKPIQYC